MSIELIKAIGFFIVIPIGTFTVLGILAWKALK